MFLLFDKVYVKYDYLIENDVDNLVITPNLQSIFLDDLKVIFSEMGNQMHNVDSLEELWTGDNAPYGNDKDFFTALKNKGTVNVHVDRDNYDKLIIRFIKLIYENMPSDVAWKIYNTFSLNSQLAKTTSFIWGTDGGSDNQKAQADAITYLSKADFLTKWNDTTLDLPWADYQTLRDEIEPKMGVEFLIANRLAGGQDHDSSLGTKMWKLLSKRCNEEVQFLKAHIFNNIYKGWAQTVLGLGDVNAEDDLMALASTNAKTAWLFDDEEKYHRPEYVAKHSNVNFRQIRDAVMQAVTQNSQTPFEENLSDTIMDLVYSNISNGYFDPSEITTILNEELGTYTTSGFECEDRMIVNVLFLNYIYKLKNANDSELSNFAL